MQAIMPLFRRLLYATAYHHAAISARDYSFQET